MKYQMWTNPDVQKIIYVIGDKYAEQSIVIELRKDKKLQMKMWKQIKLEESSN